MCGICCALGFVGADGSRCYRAKVLERSRRQRHRGPDWSGCHVDQDGVIAHDRLSIVGVESGAQPLYSSDKTQVLAVNGEIYNEQLLKKGLSKSYAFSTRSDCEVLIPLYLEHKHDLPLLLNKLNGIFAFVLKDSLYEQPIVAAAAATATAVNVVVESKTDAIVHCVEAPLAAASGPTTTMKLPDTLRWIAARDHLGIVPLYIGQDSENVWWIASELKALFDVCTWFKEFPPGHLFDSVTGRFTPWYQPPWFDPLLIPDNDLCLLGIRTQLETAVVRQLTCDVPFACLLSGGLDSSIVASIAARYCKKRVEDDGKSDAWWPQLHTFCIGLEGSPDLAAAQEMAAFLKERYGAVHHPLGFTIAEGLDALSDVVYHVESYDVTTIRASTPMYLMARKIRTMGIKMVLSGEGADEIFGGYLYFHKCPNVQELQKELVSKVRGLSKFDCQRANKSMAAWGIEARVPFLDREFVDFAMNKIAARDKLCGRAAGGRIEKWVLREAFKDGGYLPENIRMRQKEQLSDGTGYGWIPAIKAHAESVVSDAEFKDASTRFSHNTPATKEAFMIRSLFEKHFPHADAAKTVPGGPSIACSTPAAIAWDASFKEYADCSGRSVRGVHEAAYTEQHRAHGVATGECILKSTPALGTC